jgi:pyroglutamyl-peptidase
MGHLYHAFERLMMKILLTGFEAFGTVEKNPSQVISEYMAESHDLPTHIDLICEVLPVEYEMTGHLIRDLIKIHEPDAVVMLGVAASRDAINLEYHAANVDTATSPDNKGITRTNHVIDYRFDHYFKRSSTLPLDYIYYELRANGISVKRSYDAGGYVCNHLFYHALSFTLDECDASVKTGFVHVPTFEAVPFEKQLEAIHMILNIVGDADIDEKQHRHPLIQAKCDDLFAMMPDNPDWCSLISVGGLHIAHSGKPENADNITAYTVATGELGDRLFSDLAQGDFGYCIWGNKTGIFLVADLQIVPYLFMIKWSQNGSLSSVYKASKILPQALQSLSELLK